MVKERLWARGAAKGPEGDCQSLFSRYRAVFPEEVPEDFLIHHLTGSFAETVKWWSARDMLPDPETVAHFYMTVVK